MNRYSLLKSKPFMEMILLTALMLAGALLFTEAKTLFVLLPIAYFIIEGKLRGRTAAENGLDFAGIGGGLKRAWPWVLLVGVGLQTMYVLLYRGYVPEMFEHVLERASLIRTFDDQLIVKLIVLALGEEMVFRGLVQGRLQWVLKPVYAIPLTSAVFALMHLSEGAPAVVTLDLASIFLDSIVFGIIYARTRSVLVSTIAHALANIYAALLIAHMT